MTWEELIDALKIIWQTFIENPCKILRNSFILYIALPIIEWFLLALKYIIFQTPALEDQFAEASITSSFHWILNFFIGPIQAIILFILIILLVTIIYLIKEE